MKARTTLTNPAWAVAFVLLLAGCSYYFTPSDPVPRVLLYENFTGQDFGERWIAGTLDGAEPRAEFFNGRLDVYGPQHYLTTVDRYRHDMTVLVAWSVVTGDSGAEHPSINMEHPDFTVTHASGTTVEVYLYQKLGTGEREDRLILRAADQTQLASAAVASLGGSSGTLEIRFSSSPDALSVVATVPELGLILNGTAPPAEGSDAQITVGVSGLPDDPRSLDELFLLRERVNLGDLI